MSNPLKFPVSTGTFKKSFLGGDGKLEITSDQDVWKDLVTGNKPFDKSTDRVAELNLSAGTKDLQLGQTQGIKLSVDAGAQAFGRIELTWPSDDNPVLANYGVKPKADQVYLDLTLGGKASAGANAKIPGGNLPLSTSFGFGAGGHMQYTRLKPYAKTESARAILRDLLAGARLPQRVNDIAEIPAPGEVLVMSYGGYLTANAGVTAGYSLNGVKGTSVGDLDLALEYSMRAAAGIDLGYRLAGDFTIEARQGHQDDWVRFVVRKSRESQFDFAADLSLDTDLKLTGLPNSADDFLAALLGTDTASWLATLEKVRQVTDLDALEKKVDALALAFVREQAQEWLGEALTDANVQKFFGVVQEVVSQYKRLDERIVQLYESYVDKVPELMKALDKLAAVDSGDAFKAIAARNPEAWAIVRRFYGDRLPDLLLGEDDVLDDFQELVRQARDFLSTESPKRLRELIAGIKKKYKLDDIFAQLEKVASADKLAGLVDAKLQGFVGRMLDTAFDKLKGSEIGDAASRIKATLDKIEAFKKKWYGKLLDSTEHSFTLRLSYAYNRSTSRDALLDVEVNLARARGAKLARSAARGRFQETLQAYDPTLVRINKGQLTHKLEKSAQVKVNVFGWKHSGINSLVQNLDHSIESERGGLLHVFTVESYFKKIKSKEDRRGYKEELQSTFLLRALGESFQPQGAGSPTDERTREFLLQTLNELSVQYDVVQSDDMTSPRELAQYLEFARFLGMISNPADLVQELERQFPQGLGKVVATYVVRYDTRALIAAFARERSLMATAARSAARQLIGAKYTGLPRTFHLVDVGFAYLDPEVARQFDEREFKMTSQRLSFVVPGWFNPSGRDVVKSIGRSKIPLVFRLFSVEDSYVESLTRLDEAIERAVNVRESVPIDELQKAARAFVGLAGKIDKLAPKGEADEAHANLFFAIFDRLVQQATPGKGVRDSAMVLEVVPPGADESQKVTRVFTA